MCNIYSNSYVFKEKNRAPRRSQKSESYYSYYSWLPNVPNQAPQRPCRHDTLARSHCNAFFGPVKGGVELHEA